MKKNKTNSISRQFFIWNMIIISMIVALFVVFIFTTTNVFVDVNSNYTDDTVNQLSNEVLSNYDSLKNIIYYISFQDNIQQFLRGDSDGNEIDSYNSVTNTLLTAMELNANILNIIIEDNNSDMLMAQTSYYDLPEPNKNSDITVSEILDQDNNQLYFVINSTVANINPDLYNEQTLGNIHFVVRPEAFAYSNSDAYAEISTQLFLADKNGTPFWSNSEQSLPTKDEFATFDPIFIEQTGFYLAHQSAVYQPFQLLYFNFILIALVLAVVVAVAFLSFNMLVNNLVSPLRKFTVFIKELRKGDLNKLNSTITLDGYSEVVLISTEFNRMLSNIHNLTEQLNQATANLYETKLLQSNAELQYLRTQINPHFLYNTLDSITGLSVMEGSSEMIKITKSLSAVFRYSVKGGNSAQLKTEIEMVKHYISIQKMRFNDRFLVEYEFLPQSLDCIVPKMILQPLIENAFLHGIEASETSAILRLETTITKMGELEILVINSGVMIESERLKEIQSSLKNSVPVSQKVTDSIGLYNVHNRIKLIYGEYYGITISSDESGTTVRILIPAIKDFEALT